MRLYVKTCIFIIARAVCFIHPRTPRIEHPRRQRLSTNAIMGSIMEEGLKKRNTRREGGGPSSILGLSPSSFPDSNEPFCMLSHQREPTAAPHCDSHCHQLRVFLTLQFLRHRSQDPSTYRHIGPSTPPRLVLGYWVKPCGKRLEIRKGGEGAVRLPGF